MEEGRNEVGKWRQVFIDPMAPLPVNVYSIKAIGVNKGVYVTWEASNEEGIQNYTIEKSMDGNIYHPVYSEKAKNHLKSSYSWKDVEVQNGVNYYRIRINDQNGQTTFTSVVKVQIISAPSGSGISVYPNPVVNGKINVLIENQAQGKYSLRVFNAIGQLVAGSQVEHNGVSSKAIIELNSNQAKGIYRLEVQSTNGDKKVIQVIH